MILLDTNVISEALKPAPNQHVIDWLDQNFEHSALSTILLFELGAGLAQLPAGRRRDQLSRTIDRMTTRFGARIYGFDTRAASAAAQIFGKARNKGLPLQQSGKLADLQIAGIAMAYDLQLATRNVRDFRGIDLDVIDPWKS